MTIQYGCIARGTSVLCSSGPGNFTETVLSMLPNIPPIDGKKTYTSNNYEFHCLIENGLLYMCATNSGVNKQQPYGFLNEIKRRLQTDGLTGNAMTASSGGLDGEFSFVLSQLIKKYSQPGAGASSAVATVQAQVEEVKGVMSQNIERVLQRGDKLEDLMDKTEELEAGAASFQKTAKKIQKRYWWRNKKMTIILVIVALVVVLIITLIILFSTHVLPPKSDDDSKTTVKPN
ncbi:vesicle-associated membrane protein 7-like [Physella acuta]|uniref:vesicle-associated membrane protein 7-like n=1 Tax=Physella acuta TaxID=109671 RepID=UPI0027DD6C65|nr:vesicle-associated membrane protein 7-like [Physella acuta]XP_059139593.1 vesicle-associated membrane protein 7-like [Physella acuta]XP_059139594.1 vesicle-associated membrane protein 7-like [Physella acuta]